MNEVFCCEICYQRLRKISRNASDLWIDLCVYHIDGYIYVNADGFRGLKILEKNGYCLSTDSSNFLIVRLYGLHRDKHQDVFCLDPKEHG